MRAREHIINTLILDGLDEKLADAAVAAIRQWLTARIAELRADKKHGDASWYIRVRNELDA